MKSMETGRQDGGSDKNHAPFSVGKTGNISRKFLTIILKIFDKNFERLHKISDEIIDAVQSGVKEKIGQLPRANKDYVDQIRNSRKLYYSKKLHGQRMLKNIHPDIVADKCKRFFGDTYKDLSEF